MGEDQLVRLEAETADTAPRRTRRFSSSNEA
jgi:hypothetical protein